MLVFIRGLLGGLIGLALAAILAGLFGVKWWISGAVGGAVAIGVILLSVRDWQHFLAEKAQIIENGSKVKCWILRANPSLYSGFRIFDIYDYADVVFTFDQEEADLDATLSAITERALHLATVLGEVLDRPKKLQSVSQKEFGRPATAEEIRVAQVLSVEVPKPSRTPLPASITGGVEAYMVATQVMRELLPEGKLTRPYIWAAAIVDDPEGGVAMIPYPDEDD